jgi:hypothetical protein
MRLRRLAACLAGSVTSSQIGRAIPHQLPTGLPLTISFFRAVWPAGDSFRGGLSLWRSFLRSVWLAGDSFLRGLWLWCRRFLGLIDSRGRFLGGGVLAMIRYVVNDGRLLSLRATEWVMLLVGGLLAGSPLLLF